MFENFGKETKRGWQFTALEKEQGLNHWLSTRSNITARHENRAKLERLAEVNALIEELTAEHDALLAECECIMVECGKPLGTDGNKRVAAIQRLGKAFPYVLTVTNEHERADFSGWCKANGITATKVIADGFATKVKRSIRIVPAGKTHIEALTREHCIWLAEQSK
jgi:hypothetical protein